MSKPDGSVVTLRVPKQQPWTDPAAGRKRRTTTHGPATGASSPLAISSQLVPSLHGLYGVRISLPYQDTRTLANGTPLGDLLLQHSGRGRVGNAVVAGDDPTEWRTGRGWVPGGEGDDGGRYLSTGVPDFVVLEPGPGWNGATDTPPAVGNSGTPGWDAKAIARWDVVPYQTITEDFHIGVVAFHMNGIDRVEFSLNNGPWVAVREMQLNPRTEVWEYVALLRPSLMAEDGLVEVRAKVFPKHAGIPRLLAGPINGGTDFENGTHSVLLSSNYNNTLPSPVVYCSPTGSDQDGTGTIDNPLCTPQRALQFVQTQYGTADGATVYLLPGEYSWKLTVNTNYGKATERWPVITAAPGVDRDDVRYTSASSGGNRSPLICVRGITVDGVQNAFTGSSPPGFLWIDQCRLIGPGRTTDSSFFSPAWWAGIYITSTEASDNRNGIRSASFIRDCDVHTISGSPFGGCLFTLNSRATHYDASGTPFHGDVWHWFFADEVHENLIAYGVYAAEFDNQAIFAEEFQGHKKIDNVAFVNCHLSKDTTSAAGSWWEVNTNHLLLWHCSLPDQPFRWAQQSYGTAVHNLSIVGNIFLSMVGTDSLPADAVIHSNHFVDANYYGGGLPGTDITTGDPRFIDPTKYDYRLRDDSPLLGRLRPPYDLVPADLGGDERSGNTTVGPYAGPDELPVK